mgnify:CR=1 FL=1|jgi:rubredoxin
MYICTACGYLFEDADSIDDLPEVCPACEAGRDKFVGYDKSLEPWVKKAVAGYVMFPDEAGSDQRATNSALSAKVRFAVAGATSKGA